MWLNRVKESGAAAAFEAVGGGVLGLGGALLAWGGSEPSAAEALGLQAPARSVVASPVH
jgi:hypothetical protein